jgi:hypothetical protein
MTISTSRSQTGTAPSIRTEGAEVGLCTSSWERLGNLLAGPTQRRKGFACETIWTVRRREKVAEAQRDYSTRGGISHWRNRESLGHSCLPAAGQARFLRISPCGMYAIHMRHAISSALDENILKPISRGNKHQSNILHDYKPA